MLPFRIDTTLSYKVKALHHQCARAVTWSVIHHCNDSVEITSRCIDKLFSLSDKMEGSREKKKANPSVHLLEGHKIRKLVGALLCAPGHVVMKVLAL